MPIIKRTFSHELGKEEAVRRLRKFLDRAATVSDIRVDWRQDHFHFFVSIQGIRVTGSVAVEERALRLEAKLPLIAMPFSGWFGKLVSVAMRQTDQPEREEEQAAIPETEPAILFLHIPKAAGTTLNEILSNRYSIPGATPPPEGALFRHGIYYCPFGFFKDPEELVPQHARTFLARQDLRAVIGHFSFGIHAFVRRPWTYITMLRDPVDRVLSMYYYLKAQENITLKEFVFSPTYRELDNDQTRRISGLEPGFGKCDADHLELAKRNLLEHFAVVGTSERFNETLLLLKRHFGWTGPIAWAPRNVTADRLRASDLPPDIVARIQKLNLLDAELHRFASDLIDKSIAAAGPVFQDELARFKGLVG